MFKSKKWLIGLLLIFLLILAACADGDEEATAAEDNTNDDATEEKADEEAEETAADPVSEESGVVTIGYSGPLSGPAAFYGEDTLTGLEMAVNEINEAGGFEVNGQNYELNLVSLDDQYLPNEAAANAKRLVQEDDAKIIFNPHSGGIYAMQVFNEVDDFLIGAYTSEPGVLEQGNSLTWRIPPGYDIYIEPFTKYQMDTFGNKIALLAPNSQYGVDWVDLLQPEWEQAGGEVVFEEYIDFTADTDYYTIVTNALQGDPDVLFIGGASQPTALVAKQARDLGFEGGFLIMDQAKIEQMAAVFEGELSLLEGSIGTLPLMSAEFPGTERFLTNYQETYDKVPVAESGLHYAALYIYVEAMKIAGTVDDTAAIRAALDEASTTFPEENRVYEFMGVDENGANLTYLMMGIVENGEVVEITLEDLGLE
ncbi:ABC transporter substrate-binding protein [Oceanobacillus sp. CAU 1775]